MKHVNLHIEVTMPAKLTLAIVNQETWLKNKAKFFANKEEIADMLNCEPDTLEEDFGLAWDTVEEDRFNKTVSSVIEEL